MVAVCLCLLDQSPPLGPPDASPQPRQGHATVPLVVRQWVGSSPPPLRAPLPGPLPDRAGRGRDVSLGPDTLRPSQPRPGRPGRDAGGLDLVELPRLFPPPRSPGLGGLRRVACGLGPRVRTDRSGGILPSLRGGRSDYPACPPRGPRHGMDGSSAVSDSWIVCASASAIRPIATCAGSDACFADWISPGDRGGVQPV